MAKTSSVNRNEKRQRMASRDKGKRAQLKSVVMDRALPVEERFDASLKLGADVIVKYQQSDGSWRYGTEGKHRVPGTAFAIFLFGAPKLRDSAEVSIAIALGPAVIFALITTLYALAADDY